jgi:transposase
MAKPYSQDLRYRLVLAVLSGLSRRNVARSFDVSPTCVIKLMLPWETTGGCLPHKIGGHKRHALAEHEDKVRALVAAQPALTITAPIKVGRAPGT